MGAQQNTPKQCQTRLKQTLWNKCFKQKDSRQTKIAKLKRKGYTLIEARRILTIVEQRKSGEGMYFHIVPRSPGPGYELICTDRKGYQFSLDNAMFTGTVPSSVIKFLKEITEELELLYKFN